MSRSIGQEDDEGVGWNGTCPPREAVESVQPKDQYDYRN
jgi:hypothetical protein